MRKSRTNLFIILALFSFALIWVVRENKIRSHAPHNQLIQILTNQGYQNVKITDSNFSSCAKLTQIPIRFQGMIQEKIVEGIACFSAVGSGSPKIEFKN